MEGQKNNISKRDLEALHKLREAELLGDAARDLIETFQEDRKQKDTDFAKVFLTALGTYTDPSSPNRLSRSEHLIINSLIPFITYGGQIMLIQSDMQKVCGYKSRDKFTKHLKSLLAKGILLKESIGRENIWLFNPSIIKMGTNDRPSRTVKFKTSIRTKKQDKIDQN